jgi:cation:H+ antiporter
MAGHRGLVLAASDDVGDVLQLLSFRDNPLWLNLAVFAAAAVVVWLVGTRLAAYADLIADRTGLGKAFVGLVLLAVATSLPEVGTTATAALSGNAALAGNNLLGGVVMQTAVLALADLFVRKGALTFFTPRPGLLLEGTSLIVLLAIVLAGMAAGPGLAFFRVGIWTMLLFAVYLLSIYLLKQYEGRGTWKPVDPPDETEGPGEAATAQQRKYADHSTWQLGLLFAGGSAILLAAGWLVASVADALATETGLGASFVGATLVAISTSLPEVSTTIAAVRLGSLSLAVSNIFGSNAIDAALLFFADVLYRRGPILAELDRSAMFAAAAGIVMTAVYLLGLIERKNLAVLRMGLDSAAVLGLYAGSLVVLYLLR